MKKGSPGEKAERGWEHGESLEGEAWSDERERANTNL